VTSGFDILPAIDLRGGLVVRLRQGDFGRQTAFSDDPVDVATRFAADGARWLHVVDLDGARAGHPVHGSIIERIVGAVAATTSVEVSGGLRTPGDVADVLQAGAARAVVGTAALADPAFVGGLVARHGPERIVVALDVRDGRAMGEAWRSDDGSVPVDGLLAASARSGVATFEVTAIDRDGLLGGPDLDLLRRLVDLGHGAVIASGGIATIDDLAAVRAIGCAGAIVGRALYEGRLDLRSALDA
jgi:phosphoribosylformimino-5-aminoimidazole carboxamide ribotide isomerase